MYGFTSDELRILKKLTTPKKIQDYVTALPINFEKRGATCMSPRRVLKEKKAHCLEGAMLAAAALLVQGRPPLLMDLKSAPGDDDHVVALFREREHWGAIGKTNHAVLRYRDPVYRTLRELAMSFFHEWFIDDGRKMLRSFSRPLNLAGKRFNGWTTAEDDLWHIEAALDEMPHERVVTPAMVQTLRRADRIERKAGDIVEWKK